MCNASLGNRRDVLRRATGARHTHLDAVVGRLNDVPAYKRYLLFTAAFRSSIERAPALAMRQGPGLLILAPDLREDCVALGLDMPAPVDASNLGTSESAYLGAQYVLEGSSLGARVLIKDAQSLGMTAEHGARHLANQVADRSRWPAFLKELEATEPFDMEEAVAAADEVFALAIACAEEWSSVR